jgi:conjugative transfer region protein (TIGR03750 family)
MSDRPEASSGYGVLADRVDGEPPAILGLTTSELLLVFSVTVLVVLPVLVALAWGFGVGTIILAAAGFIVLGGVYVGAWIFRRLKRGRPQGHYLVMAAVLRQRVLGGRRFMLRSGHWSLGRTRHSPPRRLRS